MFRLLRLLQYDFIGFESRKELHEKIPSFFSVPRLHSSTRFLYEMQHSSLSIHFRVLSKLLYTFFFIARGNELADISADFWHIYLVLMTNQSFEWNRRNSQPCYVNVIFMAVWKWQMIKPLILFIFSSASHFVKTKTNPFLSIGCHVRCVNQVTF